MFRFRQTFLLHNHANYWRSGTSSYKRNMADVESAPVEEQNFHTENEVEEEQMDVDQESELDK